MTSNVSKFWGRKVRTGRIDSCRRAFAMAMVGWITRLHDGARKPTRPASDHLATSQKSVLHTS